MSTSTNTTVRPSRVAFRDYPLRDDTYVYTRPLLVGYGLSSSQAYATRAIAALVSNAAITPFNVVQTLAQVGSKEGQKSYGQIIEDIWNKEGLAGFFRGALVEGFRFVEQAVLNYLVYQAVRQILQDQTGMLTETNHQIANASSIILSSLLTYPLEVIRTRLVLDFDHKKYGGAMECFRDALNTEGWSGLFAGAPLSAIGNYVMIELMERIWNPIRIGLKIAPPKFVDAAIQSIITQALYYPISTVLRMVQAPTAYRKLHPDVPFDNVVEAASATVSKHGVFSLWRGFMVSAIQVLPYITLVSLTYQGTADVFERINIQRSPVGAANMNTRVERLA